MTGYSPHLAVLGQLSALDLVERFTARYPWTPPQAVAAMSRDTLIAALLPPARRRRAPVRPYRGETPWV